jgi:hypothetical protein
MGITILYERRESELSDALAEGDNLWLGVEGLRAATGWELKPEGACLGEQCVPIPRGREVEFLRDGGKRFNLAALGRLLGQPVVHDDQHGVWVFGEAHETASQALRTLEAPDFTLPDLDGRMHSLSDYRGMKRILMAWASW